MLGALHGKSRWKDVYAKRSAAIKDLEMQRHLNSGLRQLGSYVNWR